MCMCICMYMYVYIYIYIYIYICVCVYLCACFVCVRVYTNYIWNMYFITSHIARDINGRFLIYGPYIYISIKYKYIYNI